MYLMLSEDLAIDAFTLNHLLLEWCQVVRKEEYSGFFQESSVQCKLLKQ